MAGHSHWAGIKHKKGAADEKRGRLFSKLLNAVSVAAKTEPNPDFNPRLRAAIEKAEEAAAPKEKIEAAIRRASGDGAALEELLFEAYGPGGAAIIIEAVSDSRNRTVAEVKKILSDHGGKWAEPGSVMWAFSSSPGEEKFVPKFTQELGKEDGNKLRELVSALEEQNDAQRVYTNAKGMNKE